MIYIEDDRLVIKFPELHPNAGVSIDFQRTLRLPDDGKSHPLPPGFGGFPLRHIEDFDLGKSEALKKRGGVIMPMFQADALWLNFHPLVEDDDSAEYPIAVKIGTGKVCAVSGKPWNNKLRKRPQDYLVVPEQPWLDGYNVGDGIIRQFVAAPLGDGATAEEQLSKTADVGGIQIHAFPMKRSSYDKLNEPAQYEDKLLNVYYSMSIAPPSFMGLAAGGMMRQEITKDPHKMADWDQSLTERCFVTIANASQWMGITGEEPPAPPISASDYTAAGLPWFDYYGADTAAIKGVKSLGGLKPFQQVYAEQGQSDWASESIEDEKIVIQIGKRPVLDGTWC